MSLQGKHEISKYFVTVFCFETNMHCILFCDKCTIHISIHYKFMCMCIQQFDKWHKKVSQKFHFPEVFNPLNTAYVIYVRL